MSNIKKEMAGKTLIESFEFPVERGKIKEFSNALLDNNPMYREREYALKQGFRDVIAPVTFPISFGLHLPSENAVVEAMQDLGMNVATSVHGEIEFSYTRPLMAGETLTVEGVVGEIYEKEGSRGGKMTMVEIFFNMKDEDGEQVATIKNLFIERG